MFRAGGFLQVACAGGTADLTQAERLAEFAVKASYEDLSEEARRQIKLLVLDSIGCALGSLGAEPIRFVREQVDDFGGGKHCTLIGGGKTAPDRAAFYNGALVRYLDFNDSYLGVAGTAHPSDNLAPVLAAAEYAGGSGRDFMAALALAYQVQCRLCDVAEVWANGYDHTVPGSYAVAASASRALGLSQAQAAHAIAISGAAFNGLRVTRTGTISHWKGLAYPSTAAGCLHAAFLAKRGVSGPLEVFEGNSGFMEVISGPFELDWSKEDLEKITSVCIKKYNGGIYAQSAIEGALELKSEDGFPAEEIEQIEIGIYDRAYNVVGGGLSGNKHDIQNKETADHSLPYMVAAALLDDQLMPAQYETDRLLAPDVQSLLRKIVVVHSEDCTRRYPAELPCEIRITLRGGESFEKEKSAYEGFFTHPMSWDSVVLKFERLAEPHVSSALMGEIVDAAQRLDSISAGELIALLSSA